MHSGPGLCLSALSRLPTSCARERDGFGMHAQPNRIVTLPAQSEPPSPAEEMLLAQRRPRGAIGTCGASHALAYLHSYSLHTCHPRRRRRCAVVRCSHPPRLRERRSAWRRHPARTRRRSWRRHPERRGSRGKNECVAGGATRRTPLRRRRWCCPSLRSQAKGIHDGGR